MPSDDEAKKNALQKILELFVSPEKARVRSQPEKETPKIGRDGKIIRDKAAS